MQTAALTPSVYLSFVLETNTNVYLLKSERKQSTAPEQYIEINVEVRKPWRQYLSQKESYIRVISDLKGAQRNLLGDGNSSYLVWSDGYTGVYNCCNSELTT